jgi:hypothetical protein
MKPLYTRAWTSEDVTGRPSGEVIDQSDKLTARIRPILFGKHPAAQMLTLAELAGIWIGGHQTKELQDIAMESLFGAVRDFAKRNEKKNE